MNSAEEIQVNIEWLKWARETAHYNLEDISRKMDVNKDTVKNWEKTGTLEYDKLVKLAEYYHRSPMIFFNDDKPTEYRPTPDFRTISSKKNDITPSISFEIRNARNRRENLLSLEDESDEYIMPKFNFSIPNCENPEELAEIIRDKIGMNSAKMHYKLDYWIKKVEELGILVFQFYNIKPKEMRGYALYYDKLPIIGINHQEHSNGKKFTLFHELAHIIIKKEGISNFDSYSITDKYEKRCNAIAAETLVPTNMLKIKIEDIGGSREWNDRKIKILKKRFNVSSEVIVRRLLSLKKVSKKYYKEKKEEWDNYIGYTGKNNNKNNKNENYIKKEQKKDPNKANAIKASMALKRNGIYYTEMVLSAYDSQLITNSTMSEYLGETLQVIQEIRKKLPKEMGE
jgi:Zn-dependent peptidase ImmA (M78 family)